MGEPEVKRDKPWIIRTYAGHSTAAESNALYRGNLEHGSAPFAPDTLGQARLSAADIEDLLAFLRTPDDADLAVLPDSH